MLFIAGFGRRASDGISSSEAEDGKANEKEEEEEDSLWHRADSGGIGASEEEDREKGVSFLFFEIPHSVTADCRCDSRFPPKKGHLLKS